jgi:hypothetical protein
MHVEPVMPRNAKHYGFTTQLTTFFTRDTAKKNRPKVI